MALQVCSSARTSLPHNSLSPPAIIAAAKQCRRSVCEYPQLISRKRRVVSMEVRTKASSEEAAAAGEVTEVSNDTFWPIVKAAGAKIVVLDMYTQCHWHRSWDVKWSLHSRF